mmetsp:Transcript_150651/g.280865  ORF Transcript_150651/g.280865 Transcript_150651/m.280865 type:complete len:208 (-) Transcript_150651:3344-3967(-)
MAARNLAFELLHLVNAHLVVQGLFDARCLSCHSRNASLERLQMSSIQLLMTSLFHAGDAALQIALHRLHLGQSCFVLQHLFDLHDLRVNSHDLPLCLLQLTPAHLVVQILLHVRDLLLHACNNAFEVLQLHLCVHICEATALLSLGVAFLFHAGDMLSQVCHRSLQLLHSLCCGHPALPRVDVVLELLQVAGVRLVLLQAAHLRVQA